MVILCKCNRVFCVGMKKPSEEGLKSIIGEYISIAEGVIVCEQIACELLDVEIATGKLRNVGITIIKQLFCELLFAIPYAIQLIFAM